MSSGPSAGDRMETARGNNASGLLRTRKREEAYREVLMRLFVLLKVSQFEHGSGADYRRMLAEFMDSLSGCLAHEASLVIEERDGLLFLNGVRARIDVDAYAAQKFLVRALLDSEFCGILFERGVVETDVERFLAFFLRPIPPEGSSATFSSLFGDPGTRHIQPILRGAKSGSQGTPRRVAPGRSTLAVPPPAVPPASLRSKQTYFKSIFVLRHLLDAVGLACCLDLRDAKQVIQIIVDHVLDDDDSLLILDLLREWDPTRFQHAVDAAVVAVTIGRLVGLGPTLLGDLGVACLLCDLGSARLAPGARPGPSRGSFRRLVEAGGKSDLMLRVALVVHDHEESQRAVPGAADLTLLARILGCARRFVRAVESPEAGGLGEEPRSAIERQLAAASAADRPILELWERTCFARRLPA